MPIRLQLSRKKGWRLPAGAVNVARPGRWGNPYSVETFGRDLAIALFKRSLSGIWSGDGIPDDLVAHAFAAHRRFMEKIGADPTSAAVSELRGRDLVCWCRLEDTCHADVLLTVANS